MDIKNTTLPASSSVAEVDFVEGCKIIDKIYASSPALYRPSKFWERFNDLNMHQLIEKGYGRFKQTANTNYFQFMVEGVRNRYLTFFLPDYPKRELFRTLLLSRTADCPLKLVGRLVYRTYVVMLYGYVQTLDRLHLIDRVHEPEEGTPVKVFYEGKMLSQDILNSAQEFYALDEVTHISDRDSLIVGEIGAGYGRIGFLLANVFASKRFKYCIFDVPPALCVSQHYLSRVFPKAKTLTIRDFKSFSEIEKEFNEAQFCFFLPHQIELLPPKIFDLFISVSNLPEMTKTQVDNYFVHIDRLCRGYFYNKQFWIHMNPHDGYTMRFLDYPAPSHWSLLLLRPVRGKVDFFEAVYQIPNKKAHNTAHA